MTGRRRMAVAAASAAALLAAAACGSDEGGENGDDDDGNVTISLHDFGGAGFGYTDLVAQFEDEHPNITVDYQTTTDDYDGEYRPTLLQQLDAGTAPDIAAVEEGAIGQFMAAELDSAWVDLAEYGLDSREADYPAWKWELGHTVEGKLAALGTDVGGMGLCYRTDRFDEAGLPTDREEVAALWPTWDDFVSVAQDFVNSGVDAAFVDSVAQIFNVRMIQAAGEGDGTSYFNRDDEYVAGESPAVQEAFDLVSQLHEIGAIGQFDNFSEDWNTAMGPGGFAVMACPAWMTGVVEGNAGDAGAGNWDFTSVPGVAGNWGGAWLGVTSSSEHPEEAAMLVDFLTSPDGQLGANEAVGTFPSAPAAQEELLGSTNAYFNDAPVNEIVAESVQAYQPVFFGSLHSAVKQPFEAVLLGMVAGEYSVDEAFAEAVAAGEEAVQLGG